MRGAVSVRRRGAAAFRRPRVTRWRHGPIHVHASIRVGADPAGPPAPGLLVSGSSASASRVASASTARRDGGRQRRAGVEAARPRSRRRSGAPAGGPARGRARSPRRRRTRACEDVRSRCAGSGPRLASKRCTVPGVGAGAGRVDHHRYVRAEPDRRRSAKASPSCSTRRRAPQRGEQSGGVVAAAPGVADRRSPPPRSAALDLEREEVRRAGDARVVVADRLLAAAAQLVVAAGRRGAARTPRRSSSIARWFCDVGGTICASRIVPSSSIS